MHRVPSEMSLNKIRNLVENPSNNRINFECLPAVQKLRVVQTRKFSLIVLVVLTAGVASVIFRYRDLVFDSKCLIAMPGELSKAFRRMENCDFCRNVQEAIRIEKTSPAEFEEKFAYSARPVIITDATQNWTAGSVFDFWYFKSVYETAQRNGKQLNCQFFPYKSGLKSLHEALSIPKERVEYANGAKPWYFGWSNCNFEVAELLRQHYGRPYFLPETSENNAIDWIFMGGPGLGAHMHVDNVRLASWQAQIKGEKEWTIAPPPECHFECQSFTAVIRKGEICKYTWSSSGFVGN